MGKRKILKQKKQVLVNGEWVDTRSYRYVPYCDGCIPCVIIRGGRPNGTVKLRTRKLDGSTIVYPGDITSGDKKISLDEDGNGYIELESDDCIVYVREIIPYPYGSKCTAEIRGCIVNSFGGTDSTDSGMNPPTPKTIATDADPLIVSCSVYARRVPYYSKDFKFYGSNLILRGFETPRITDMSGMFYGFKYIKSLDLKEFDTSNVTDMGSMFGGCKSLISLDLSSFDTSKVTNMGYDEENTWVSGMFEGCSSLKSLNVSSFNTSNVTDMTYMFNGCSGLTSLDLSNFNTSNVTDMTGMFGGCSSLKSLNVSNFDVSNTIQMHSMFAGCSSLTSLDLSSFKTDKVTLMSNMFYGCSGLTSLDLSGWNTSNVKKQNMSNIFYYCSNLESLDLSGWDMSKITHGSLQDDYIFKECPKLTTIRAVGCSKESITRLRGQLAYVGMENQVTIIT